MPNAFFINISIISWGSVLMVEKFRVPAETEKPTSCLKSMTNFITQVVSSFINTSALSRCLEH
jgi:hypothetical protein